VKSRYKNNAKRVIPAKQPTGGGDLSMHMTKQEAHLRIQTLRKAIDRHRYLYHVLNKQDISDEALDSLKHELYILEQKYPEFVTKTSPTQRVAGEVLEGFKKVKHDIPMLSIEDVFSEEEFSDWEERIKKLSPHSHFDYYAEVKMDGLAVSLVYRDGVFSVGSTRGDGKEGEDVTHNLKTIEAIPLQLRTPSEHEINHFLHTFSGQGIDEKKFRHRLNGFSGDIEVRGEVFMEKKVFDALNKQQKKKEEPLFANPRNVSAGSIRQLDSKIVASRHLDFFGYALMRESSFGITTHQQTHELLRMIGIKTNLLHEVYCKDRQAVVAYHKNLLKKRESLPYWTDGVVVVVNYNALCERLGVVGKTPRCMIAFKFPGQQATTVLKSVSFQVGRTGVLTPVATFESTLLAGTTVTHATLHNIDEIERLNVRIGDTVIIEKAGDIIPKVIRVVREMRSGQEKKIHAPHVCPVCGSHVIRLEGEVALRCSNKQCFAKEREQIIHFVSKKAFNIDGLGEKIIDQLIHNGLIYSAADLFILKQGDLEPLERFAEKSAKNLIDAIQASRHIELTRFIYALGIHHIGEETAFDLAQRFGVLERLLSADQEALDSIPNIGPVVAKSIYEYMQDSKNKTYIHELLKNGVVIKNMAHRMHQTLQGKTFVLTGTLESLTRDEAKEKIRARGGDVSSSVSKETDYVVAGIEPGSKYDKAKKIDVRIIHEKEFLGMLAG